MVNKLPSGYLHLIMTTENLFYNMVSINVFSFMAQLCIFGLDHSILTTRSSFSFYPPQVSPADSPPLLVSNS